MVLPFAFSARQALAAGRVFQACPSRTLDRSVHANTCQRKSQRPSPGAVSAFWRARRSIGRDRETGIGPLPAYGESAAREPRKGRDRLRSCRVRLSICPWGYLFMGKAMSRAESHPERSVPSPRDGRRGAAETLGEESRRVGKAPGSLFAFGPRGPVVTILCYDGARGFLARPSVGLRSLFLLLSCRQLVFPGHGREQAAGEFVDKPRRRRAGARARSGRSGGRP